MNTEIKKQVSKKPLNVKVSDKVKSHGDDPYFVKKANKYKTFLESHGFSKELLDKR